MLKFSWRRALLMALTVLWLIPLAPSSFADTPSIFSMFKKKPVVSEEALQLKAEHGPWLILAKTMSGPESEARAIALAKEIRSEMGLASFVWEKTFDTSGELAATSRLVPELDGTTTQFRARKMYINGAKEQVFSVLVGEFTSMDGPQVEETVAKLRTAHPKSLSIEAPRPTSLTESESSTGIIQRYRSKLWASNDRKDESGPMGAAFITRNPLLPAEYFLNTPKVDSFVTNLNKNVEYSLLDNPGKYTVRVAAFTGKEVTDFGNGSRASEMSNTTDALDKAAFKAHKLTAALRKENVEAYEFHDRYGSYVMIGSFDSLGQELTPGQFQYNSAMLAIMKEYCGYRNIDTRDPITGAVTQMTSVKSKDRIPFALEGKPMAVPRPEGNRIYGNSLLGRG
ncbi:hypothetical protein [Aureliella helgolandensis]|uniref:Uncharacterized protein n=1 Tax=Aureliella helgolandensis TaxID=2527968 RepID=A0A518GDI5_9BACT|nr:hypothetical protein [Aureliella helgolandensis]QDV26653.1 hypothetical protein Q31a_50290 [Aureliella helgolandensis]